MPGQQLGQVGECRVAPRQVVERGVAGVAGIVMLGTPTTAGFIVALGMKPNLQRCLAGPAGLANQLEGCGDNRNSAFGTLTLVGYVAGYAIDSFMKKTLYVSPQSGGSVSIAPVLRPGHQGRAVGVRLTLSTSHPAVSP